MCLYFSLRFNFLPLFLNIYQRICQVANTLFFSLSFLQQRRCPLLTVLNFQYLFDQTFSFLPGKIYQHVIVILLTPVLLAVLNFPCLSLTAPFYFPLHKHGPNFPPDIYLLFLSWICMPRETFPSALLHIYQHFNSSSWRPSFSVLNLQTFLCQTFLSLYLPKYRTTLILPSH